MRRPALRWALLVPVVSALLIGIVGLGVFVERSVQADLVEAVDDELRRAAARDLGRPDGPPDGTPQPAQPAQPEPEGTAAETPTELRIDADGTVTSLTRDASPFVDDQAAGWLDRRGAFTVTTDADVPYRVLATPGREGSTAIVALPVDSIDESMASLRRNLILGGAGLFVMQGLVVWARWRRASEAVG